MDKEKEKIVKKKLINNWDDNFNYKNIHFQAFVFTDFCSNKMKHW